MFRSACSLAAIAALLAGCAVLPPEEPEAPPALARFSLGSPGPELPQGWRSLKLSRFKKSTDYRLVDDAGRTVVHAHADSAASGLVHDIDVDPGAFPVLRWRWKVASLIPGADNTVGHAEDSPVRVILTFAGDKARWDFPDRLFATQVRMLSGHELPYATLIYIWENRAAKETIIANAHTSRVKMIVVRSGKEGVGRWCEETRNLHDDYLRAFGEEPPRVTSVGIMTDSDNTGAVTHGFYGDISFAASDRAARSPRSVPAVFERAR